jgi:hypothetical protein
MISARVPTEVRLIFSREAAAFGRSGQNCSQRTARQGDHFGSSRGNRRQYGGRRRARQRFSRHFRRYICRYGFRVCFHGSGATWTQQAQLSQEMSAEYSATERDSAAARQISGETILAGIPGADNEDGFAGVYVRSGTSWTLQDFLGENEDSTERHIRIQRRYRRRHGGRRRAVRRPRREPRTRLGLCLRAFSGNQYVVVSSKLTASDGAPESPSAAMSPFRATQSSSGRYHLCFLHDFHQC